MKSIRSVQSSLDVSSLSIPEAEEIIEEALGELAFSQDPGLVRAMHFLAPDGYEAVVELCGESGRSKRRTASASSWNPEEDEIRIYFERIEEGEPTHRAVRSTRGFQEYAGGGEGSLDIATAGDMDARIKELCTALSEAERGGHAFIALKWFRDSFLPRKQFRWNRTAESRQVVLAEAIQRGVVLTSKIANPKTPAYPTTTIRLNRAESAVPDEGHRFQPIASQGSIEETIEEARGKL